MKVAENFVDTTKGEIYFIREIEAGQFSPHTKIGLISYKKDRSSTDRLPEHQTGNPRKLVLAHAVVTDCVTAVETYMHRKFASHRGLGEWFQFDEIQLINAIEFCERLSKRFSEEAAVFDASVALKDIKSNGENVEATAESMLWFGKHVASAALIRESEKLTNMYEELIREAEMTGIDTSRNAEFRSTSRSVFNEKGFKEKYLEIWDMYAHETLSISGRFVIEKDDDLDVDIANDFPDFASLRDQFAKFFSSDESHARKLEILKVHYLDLLGYIKEAKIEKEIAEAHLKSICGAADGIFGICKWKRIEKSIISLDKKSLELNHPNEFKEFLTLKTVESLVTEKSQGAPEN